METPVDIVNKLLAYGTPTTSPDHTPGTVFRFEGGAWLFLSDADADLLRGLAPKAPAKVYKHPLRMTAERLAVLQGFAANPYAVLSAEAAWGFPVVEWRATHNISDVRRLCRLLTRHGLLELKRGLMDEEGAVRGGAGWRITEKGRAAYQRASGGAGPS